MTYAEYFQKVVDAAERIVFDETRASIVAVHVYLVGTLALTDIAEHAAYGLHWPFDMHVALVIHAMTEDRFKGLDAATRRHDRGGGASAE